MSDRYRGTLYIGVTSRFLRRIQEHREGLIPGFTKTYGLDKLVWFEQGESMVGAIQREKTLKHWPRQ
ncbi:MAG: Excinuclease subunit domain protein [Caulobacter sp.]|nr:Excinuclease subunit domain protein [Caulobacter sp.]